MKKIISLCFLLFLFSTSSSFAMTAAEDRDALEAAAAPYLEGAKAGDPEAQADLGIVYLNESGKFHNYPEAKKLFTKAARQKNERALYYLGFMYYKGRGTVQDFMYAYVWYGLAGRYGSKEGAEKHKVLANMISKKEIKKAEAITKAWLEKYDPQ